MSAPCTTSRINTRRGTNLRKNSNKNDSNRPQSSSTIVNNTAKDQQNNKNKQQQQVSSPKKRASDTPLEAQVQEMQKIDEMDEMMDISPEKPKLDQILEEESNTLEPEMNSLPEGNTEISEPESSDKISKAKKKKERRRSSGFKITSTIDEETNEETTIVEREEPAPLESSDKFYFTPSKKRRRDTILSTITERTECSTKEGLSSETLKSEPSRSNSALLSDIDENTEKTENSENVDKTSEEAKPENSMNPEITVVHDVTEFETELSKTNSKLDTLASKWKQILEEESENLTENDIGDINAAVGKVSLLQTKKFKQYSNLISYCRLGEGDPKEGNKKILPNDLRGHWDLIGMQLDLIYDTFEDLQKRKDRGWKEEERKKIVKKVVKKVKKVVTKDGSSKSSSDEAKKAARARLMAAKKLMLERKKREEEEARKQNESMNIEEMEVEEGGNASFHIL